MALTPLYSLGLKTTFGRVNLIFIIWALAAVWLMLHYVFFHSRLLFLRKEKKNFDQPVSVIICAHNEAHNLERLLHSVLNQEYPNGFEVLVVNDHSMDDSERVVDGLKKSYHHLKVVNFTAQKQSKGKKEALLFGIENAKYDHLLFTDADCKPVSENWLGLMVQHFTDKEIVLGVSPHLHQSNLAGWLTAWETFLTCQQYISFAKAGLPYMGVGRNMAYTRKIFEQSSKMKNHLHLPSGDDDLLINEVATSQNVAVEIFSEAQTTSAPPENFAKWWGQKRRHLTTSYYYKKKVSMLLATFGLAQLLFYVLLVPTVFWFWNEPMMHLLLWGKLALQIATMVPFAVKTHQLKSVAGFVIIEPLVILFLGIIHLQNKISGSSKDW